LLIIGWWIFANGVYVLTPVLKIGTDSLRRNSSFAQFPDVLVFVSFLMFLIILIGAEL
jgi:hypothetical protein